MEHTSISDLSINLELSLDGRDYYQIDNLNITDRETVEKAMTLFLTELHRIDAKQQRLDFNSGNQLYLRLNRASKENYNDHLLKQSDLYESLTIKEKIILCFIGRGHRRKQTAYVLKIKINTFSKHQKNIYRKMGFHNKVQMAVWCDKYLEQFFQIC